MIGILYFDTPLTERRLYVIKVWRYGIVVVSLRHQPPKPLNDAQIGGRFIFIPHGENQGEIIPATAIIALL